MDYVAFRLGGREETTLLVGWTPVKGGGVRDSFIVKFGKFSAQVILIGSCLAPEEKKAIRGAPRPRPLGPKNASVGKRPSLASSKLHAAAPKITIPANPVVRKNHSPEKHLMEGMSPPKEQPQPQVSHQHSIRSNTISPQQTTGCPKTAPRFCLWWRSTKLGDIESRSGCLRPPERNLRPRTTTAKRWRYPLVHSHPSAEGLASRGMSTVGLAS